MKVKLLIAAALLCGVVGCRDPGAGPQDPWGDSDSETTQGSTANAPSPVNLSSPLPGGVAQLDFPYHLSLDRKVGRVRDGRQPREIGLELLGPGPVEAEVELSRLLTDQGAEVTRRQVRGGAIRIVYTLSDGTQMLAWFRPGPPPGPSYALQMLEATGTVYLAWPYVPKDDR